MLLHPTSLPNACGIGDFGPSAYRFVDFLVAARQRLWQVLPLNPTGPSRSPYQCFSSFAGEPLLISPELLVEAGLLGHDDLAPLAELPSERVDYDAVAPIKAELLRRAFAAWRAQGDDPAFAHFCASEQSWLDDYALFATIKQDYGGADWAQWSPDFALRQPTAIEHVRTALGDEWEFQRWVQYQFRRQWGALKRYANERGVSIVGDMPIFVAGDSADVWANPQLFFLNEHNQPTMVAGVPPDYFSATGQRWGNPLYNWDAMAQTGYAWWIARVQATFQTVDVLRIDHFRGFEAYWAIPAHEETAINGRWMPGPGAAVFEALRATLGPLPIIAEDLGIITPPVEQLRRDLGFPGMRVLQFAFDGKSNNAYLPHNYDANSVVYTGTHDNDTTLGWWLGLPPEQQQQVLRYLGHQGDEPSWDLMRLASASVAHTAIFPLQDLLALGSEARMNRPGVELGNWDWRYAEAALRPELAERLAEITRLYGRDE
jgi:4-alpha-glucanotransferase